MPTSTAPTGRRSRAGSGRSETGRGLRRARAQPRLTQAQAASRTRVFRREVPMKRFTLLVACALAGLVASGCATTNFSPDGSAARAGKLAKPGRVIVYPFAATTSDLAPEERGDYVDASGSAQHASVGRELG